MWGRPQWVGGGVSPSGLGQLWLPRTRRHRSLGDGKGWRGLAQRSVPAALTQREGRLAQCDSLP